MTILLWILATVVAVLLAMLAAPLRIEFRASAGEVLRYSVALRLFGSVGPRVSVADSDRPKRRKARSSKKKSARARSGRRRRGDPKRIAGAALRLISEIFDRIHFDRAAVDLRFGAQDPAETGEIYGALTPFIYGTCGSPLLRLNVQPVFDHAVLDGRAALDLTLTPARLIPPILRFGWSAFGPRR